MKTKPTMTKRRVRCCFNGCKAPIQPPSLVLCKECLEALGKKFDSIAQIFEDKKLRAGSGNPSR